MPLRLESAIAVRLAGVAHAPGVVVISFRAAGSTPAYLTTLTFSKPTEAAPWLALAKLLQARRSTTRQHPFFTPPCTPTSFIRAPIHTTLSTTLTFLKPSDAAPWIALANLLHAPCPLHPHTSVRTPIRMSIHTLIHTTPTPCRGWHLLSCCKCVDQSPDNTLSSKPPHTPLRASIHTHLPSHAGSHRRANLRMSIHIPFHNPVHTHLPSHAHSPSHLPSKAPPEVLPRRWRALYFSAFSAACTAPALGLAVPAELDAFLRRLNVEPQVVLSQSSALIYYSTNLLVYYTNIPY